MTQVFIESHNIISPLGFTSSENFENVRNGKVGITVTSDSSVSLNPIPVSKIDFTLIDSAFDLISNGIAYTKFEKLAILSVHNALQNADVDFESNKVLFLLSTTKGNVELLDESLSHSFPQERLELHNTAQVIADFFGKNIPTMVVSNACISGVAATVLAQRLISQGEYDTVIVNGTDIITKFVVSGFQSFLSLSPNPCKPFDANRDGLSLGEGSATIILSNKKSQIELVRGATSNDANHISGPSRTGEGLYQAIRKTIGEYQDISLISAHGTATLYNDDMESMAIQRNELAHVPTNSLKGYFGHTLGAAGVIESVISILALEQNVLINTIGCKTPGTAENITIIQETKQQKLTSLLKLASGFGGCNAAALFMKHE